MIVSINLGMLHTPTLKLCCWRLLTKDFSHEIKQVTLFTRMTWMPQSSPHSWRFLEPASNWQTLHPQSTMLSSVWRAFPLTNIFFLNRYAECVDCFWYCQQWTLLVSSYFRWYRDWRVTFKILWASWGWTMPRCSTFANNLLTSCACASWPLSL